MANISGYVGMNTGDYVLATVVSTNFAQVAAGVNSNALNSDNYGQSSILSQHISTNAILSQHISDSQIASAKISTNAVLSQHISVNAVLSQHISDNQIVSAKISTDAVLSQHISDSQVLSQKISQGAIVHDHLNFASTADGLRVIQIGAASDSMPAGGVVMGRLSETFSHATSTAPPVLRLTHNWSDCEEGNPGFTNTPFIMGEPIWLITATNTRVQGPKQVEVVTADSVSAEITYRMSLSLTDAFTGTVFVGAIGER